MSPTNLRSIVCFGVFEFNLRTGELTRQGLKIKLGNHATTVLSLLVENPGQIRTREDLRNQLWPAGTYVNFEAGLNQAIHELRAALHDSAGTPHFIETVPNQGYRFIPTPLEGDRRARKAQSRRIESLAVLPLGSEPPDPGTESLGRTITMQIIKVLSLLRTARVLAYNIVKHYKGQQANPESLGGALPVQAILVGEMDRRDAELFLQLELIDMSDGSHRWGGQFRKTWSDVCSRPEELASEVCDQLRPILAPKRHAA